jgi:hypothetical protein
LLAVVFLLVSALPVWLATDGVLTGVVRMRGGSYSRSKEPVFFWIIEALYGGLAAYCWYLALDVSLTH